MDVKLYRGNCVKLLDTLPEAFADSCVTDPPYDLTSASRNGSSRVPGTGPFGRHRCGTKSGGFMGKEWDGTGIAFRPETWAAVLRVLKPGAYLLAFGGTRTFHRMACAIEDAGFVLQDTCCWLYGSGFPKHKSKLKPAWEPIIMAWKPDRYATPLPGLDRCRIACAAGDIGNRIDPAHRPAKRPVNHMNDDGSFAKARNYREPQGRWPANVVLDEEAARLLDEQSGITSEHGPRTIRRQGKRAMEGWGLHGHTNGVVHPGTGGASRFFYCPKAGRKERNGCEDLKPLFAPTMGNGIGGKEHDPETATPKMNTHPTVKPLALCRWLVKLITPPGGLVLDCFLGSGSTGVACVQEGFRFVGIEREADYLKIARRRIKAARQAFPRTIATR